MKRVALIAAAVFVAAPPVLARDVTLTFNDEEQRALIQVLDAATKANGLEQAKVTLYFLNKLQAPPHAAPAPPAGGGSAPAKND